MYLEQTRTPRKPEPDIDKKEDGGDGNRLKLPSLNFILRKAGKEGENKEAERLDSYNFSLIEIPRLHLAG